MLLLLLARRFCYWLSILRSCKQVADRMSECTGPSYARAKTNQTPAHSDTRGRQRKKKKRKAYFFLRSSTITTITSSSSTTACVDRSSLLPCTQDWGGASTRPAAFFPAGFCTMASLGDTAGPSFRPSTISSALDEYLKAATAAESKDLGTVRFESILLQCADLETTPEKRSALARKIASDLASDGNEWDDEGQ